jgi:hypothetical protein
MVAMMAGQQGQWQGNHIDSGTYGNGNSSQISFSTDWGNWQGTGEEKPLVYFSLMFPHQKYDLTERIRIFGNKKMQFMITHS